jgi:carbonic anhydrase/SulP family sulfate permease
VVRAFLIRAEAYVAMLSGSAVGISGPAEGLTVIVFSVIEGFDFESFLLSLVLVGFFQIFMGLCRVGVIRHYFPSAVIKGMVSGIDIILCLKQIPHAFGFDADYEGSF